MWILLVKAIKSVNVFVAICLAIYIGWIYYDIYTVKAKYEAYMNTNGGDIDQRSKDIDKHGKDIDQHGKDIDQHGKYIDQHGKDIDQHGKDIDQHGKDINQRGKDIEQHGKDIYQHGKDINQRGKDIDQHGKDIDQHGKDINQRGKDIDQHGKDIDQHGIDINQRGKDINQRGKGIDKHGKDKNGTHIDKDGLALNWTLLLTVNDGFFDFFLNWFWYYKKLDLHLPIIIVAEDDIVFKKLKSTCDYCSVLRSDLNLSGAVMYRSLQYNQMVSTRPQHILHVLRSGKNVIYADIDSVWLQNPLPFLNKSVDIAAQLDGPGKKCTGFIAIRSNAKTIDVIQQWHAMIADAPGTNQGPFNTILKKNKYRIILAGLDPLYFPSGKDFFEKYNTNKRSYAVIVHNNWIVGHDAKKNRFQNFKMWQL